MRRGLIIVGKAPRAGRTKTRLVPPLSPEQAADLSAAFLLDTVELGLGLGWECVTVVHPAEAGEAELLLDVLPPEVRLSAQVGHGLGSALRGAFATHFEEQFERVVLVDSDSPTLPPAILAAACAGLDGCDVTLGPSVDGGYYLLGLRQRQDRLFEGIAWSTPRVFEQTLRRAQPLSVACLPEWYDVDVPADLSRLSEDLAHQASGVASHTREVLARLAVTVG
jgi:rSAM/selenodomain-associated transferase 1